MYRPLLWFAISWIGGTLAAFAVPGLHASVWMTPGALLLAAFVWLKGMRRANEVAAVLLLLASFGYTEWRDGRNVTELASPGANLDALSGSEVDVAGTIGSAVIVDGDRATFIVAAKEVRFGGGETQPVNERMRVSVRLLQRPEQDEARTWERTDTVQLSGVLLRPEPSRNFGGFDYRAYLRRQHVHWLVSVKGAEAVTAAGDAANRFSPSRLLLWNDRLRTALAARMAAIFPADQAGLMKGMLIGWQDDMDPEQYGQFSRLGLTHILAISGANVAVFLGLLFALLKRLRVTKETSLLIGIALMPGYVLLTGASPSVVRAGLMAMVALYAARRGWLKDGLHVAALAAWAMLVWEPYYVYDVGFQLSFLITAALLLGVPRVASLLPIRTKGLRSAAAITIVSQLVSFPITVVYFNGFSLLSWLANLLFVPVFGVVLFPASLVSVFAGLVWLPLGRLLGAVSGLLSRVTVAAIGKLAAIDGFQLIWPTPSALWVGLYFAGLIVLYAAAARRFASLRAEDGPLASLRPAYPAWPALAAAGFLCLLLVYGYTPDRWNRAGSVEFLDVGQGDSALIRTPSHQFILVDGGGTLDFRKAGEEWKQRRDPFEVGADVVVPLLKQHGVHKLSYVIATHEDQDHIGGLQAVAEQIPIGAFIFNGTLKPGPHVNKLFHTLLDKNVPLVSAQSVPSLRPDAATELRFLMPPPQPAAARQVPPPLRLAPVQNDESVVFLLEMQGYRWLFTGDMEKAEENAALASLPPDLPPAPIDVLKVAHHGSKTSSTGPWLDRWHPKLAVISVGARNSYGHPAPQVLQRLEAAGIAVKRTDRDGAVRTIVGPDGLRTSTRLP